MLDTGYGDPRSLSLFNPAWVGGGSLPAYADGPLTGWLENHFLFMLFPSVRSGIRRSLILLCESLSRVTTFE
jgi:hypothetical protein